MARVRVGVSFAAAVLLSIAPPGHAQINLPSTPSGIVSDSTSTIPAPRSTFAAVITDHEYQLRMQRLQEHQHLCARCLCYGLRPSGKRVALDEELNEIPDDSPRPRVPSTDKWPGSTLAPHPIISQDKQMTRGDYPPAVQPTPGTGLQVLVINCTERLPAEHLLGWSWPAKLSVGEKVSEETWAEFRGGNLSGVARLARLPFRLTNLSLADNKLLAIAPRAFANLAQLRHLDLRHNHLKDVPHDGFAGLSSLEWLDLSFNALGSNRVPALPVDLFKGIDTLTALNLRNNALQGDLNGNTLPMIRSLSVLDLSRNKFSSLSAGAWSRVSKLKDLDLSWNELQSITPHAFEELTVLERLDLSHNPLLGPLPGGVLAGLDGLRVLDLSHCPVGHAGHAGHAGLPTRVEAGAERAYKLPAGVRELRLASCGLNEFLLHNWGGLHELRVLDLADNDLSVLSDIAHLVLLQELNVSHNVLARFPTVSLPELEVLDLSFNQLETPPVLSARLTPRLRQLNLDGNALEELRVGVPPSLRSISARGMSRLSHLPQSAVFIANSSTTDVGANNCLSIRISQNPALSSVHEKAFEDLRICQLDLSHNALTWVSSKLARWDTLDAIDLQGNPWVCSCKLQWMLDMVVKRMYASHPEFLEELRCAAPKSLNSRRLVHWYNHTGSALCDADSLAMDRMELESLVKGASIGGGVTFSVSTAAMVAIVSAAAATLFLVVLGILAHRKYSSRRRARNRRL